MKSKGVAILLCVFLGGLGAHKFYLGQSLKGLLFLALFWTCIPLLVSIFNLIGLLMLSEERFNKIYN